MYAQDLQYFLLFLSSQLLHAFTQFQVCEEKILNYFSDVKILLINKNVSNL